MIALYIILGILLLLFLVSIFPISIRLLFSNDIEVFVPILFFKIKVYPRTKKLSKLSQKDLINKTNADEISKLKKEKKRQKKEAESSNKPKVSIKNLISSFGEIKDAVIYILSKFTHFLQIKIYRLHIIVSSEDASKTALEYGSICAGLSVLLELMNEYANIKYADEKPTVECDFLNETPKIEVDIKFRIRIYQVIIIGIKALFSFIKIKNKLEDKQNA